ncbi:MAG: hypothetical protein PUF81_03070 [Lachnospiraceae bacterium]|nr:hypothetical protein [Lachnospiraceae bacterium]
MTDRELLEAIYNDMQLMKAETKSLQDDMKTTKEEMQSMKEEMQSMKAEIRSLQDDMKTVKEEMQSMKAEIKSLQGDMSTAKDEIETLYMDTTIIKEKVTRIELTLENETNHNIQLLAENHISIVDKLNDAIRVQDKSSLYEVQISGLKLKLEKLENEIKEIKTKIA